MDNWLVMTQAGETLIKIYTDQKLVDLSKMQGNYSTRVEIRQETCD
jgi:hypothetical protein